MKKTLTFISFLALALLVLFGNASAQPGIRTVKGDFYNITRTVEQTADSITFIADTLTFEDGGGATAVGNFAAGDSIVIFFVHNRFRIVNDWLQTTPQRFDYIYASVANSGARLGRQAYAGPADAAQTGVQRVAIRPFYRRLGNIAFSSDISTYGPDARYGSNALRQVISFYFSSLDANESVSNPIKDRIQVKNIYFKPNINNLMGLAVPPDTTKDILRAYHLDAATGSVVNAGPLSPGWTDLAVVRLLPGTTKYLVWVKDSAQAVDAGEYIGSFGDYSRGRFFLGDDGLPFDDAANGNPTYRAGFRPGQYRTFVESGVTVANPDWKMMVDGLPPERNPIKLSGLYQILCPGGMVGSMAYPNQNPVWGLIPPYRVHAYAAAASYPYQPGLVTSGIDTLRFYDTWGNRTWDRTTQPTLKALSYTRTTNSIDDYTGYLRGYTAADDTLRQYGQIVYRRLAYTFARHRVNVGGVLDSIRIVANAVVTYRGLGGMLNTMDADPDTSGGFPRKIPVTMRPSESSLDNVLKSWFDMNDPSTGFTIDGVQLNPSYGLVGGGIIEPYRTPLDPLGPGMSLPNTGLKIVLRPNIPRHIDINTDDTWKSRNQDKDFLNVGITVYDGYGNEVDDNEKYKMELSPFGKLVSGNNYIRNGVFDSLVTDAPNVLVSGMNLDSGRVYVNMGNLARAQRVFRHAGIGAYRIRVRSTWALNDRFTDLHDPYKVDPFPTGNPSDPSIFNHINNIPDGSPNNVAGYVYPNVNPVPGNFYNPGNRMQQTTAFDSTDVIWDGTDWQYTSAKQLHIEVVLGTNDALVVGRVGGYVKPGDRESIYDKLYVRVTDVQGNPKDITPYFDATNIGNSKVFVELPENSYYLSLYSQGLVIKEFFGSVSPNVAGVPGGPNGPGCPSNPPLIASPAAPAGYANPPDKYNAGDILNAELVDAVNNGFGYVLPGINGDAPTLAPYKAVRFYLRAPKNVRILGLDGTDKIKIQAHLVVATMAGVTDFSVSSGIAEMSVIPDVVQTVEIFHSEGKPQGTTVPMEGWNPMTTEDALNQGYPTGTPATEADSRAMYSGYFFRARQPYAGESPRQTSETFPVVITSEAYIGAMIAGPQSIDDDCTAPIPMDEVTVSENTKQVRLVARILDKYNNPVGARNVKFHIDPETLPITPDLDANGKRIPFRCTANNQYGAFGTVRFDPSTSTYYTTNVQNDTVKKSTIGDTLTAGWVTAYYNSGFVGHQIVRIAVTPDTMAWDLSDIGRNIGEGTIVGTSYRGYAPRVIIPIYLRPDTVAERVEIFPYTASSLSPIPLPVDEVQMAALEDISIYGDAKQGRRDPITGQFPCPNQDPGCYRDDPLTNYAPSFSTFSANPKWIETRVTHFGRKANTNIRPYIPDTLNLVSADLSSPNTITAGRIITLLARKYDKYGNLIGSSRLAEGQATVLPPEDTARTRFRMWAENKATLPVPYQLGLADGQFVPAFDWTRDEYGPMRKARYRHTIISNKVHESAGKGGGNGVFINQTAFCTALEFPTPKLYAATLYFEATAVSVINTPNTTDPLPRDTVKIVSVLKNPTRYDVVRGGVEYIQDAGQYLQDGAPEVRAKLLPPTSIVGLPTGEDDPQQFNVDANGVDHVLLSQVYKYNVNNYRVGKYECVDVNNVPLDKNGESLYDATGAINQNFAKHPYSGMPLIHKFSAKNSSSATLNQALPGEVLPPNARSGSYTCHVAGGGDGIGINLSAGDRRPVLFRITPVWENNPAQSGGAPYSLNMFTGANIQPGQTRVYEARLYADTIYTWNGYKGTDAAQKAKMTRIEFMGTRTDRAAFGGYGQLDRFTRLGVYHWNQAEWATEGLPCATNVLTDRTLTGSTVLTLNQINGGENATKFAGDYNRRYLNAASIFSRGVQNAQRQTIAPGFFFKLVDSTSDQVIDVRIVDPSLLDMAGRFVDDTNSYDRGKTLVVRRENRNNARLFHQDDTYKDQANMLGGIQGPNYNVSTVSEIAYDKRPPSQVTPIQPDEAAVSMPGFGVSSVSPMSHTIVVVPYRIAFTSIFPSSFDVSQNLFDMSRLPLGILPCQTDIDTLPRINLGYYQNPQGIALNQYELFTRLYGQIVHGATDWDPYYQTGKQPYARPDTIYRDITYTYAITPYDRYGNLNTRDSMFISVGARFTDWKFLDLQGSGGDAYLLIRAGGQYLRCIPENTPTNYSFRRDTLRLFNPLNLYGTNRNAWLGIKPDDAHICAEVGDAMGQTPIADGLLPVNIIASRPVDVKKAFAPAPFTLNFQSSQNTWGNPSLFRIDYTGDCDGKGNPAYANNILHLKWRSALWTNPKENNNPNDTIRYEWNALIDSMGTVRRVAVLADNDGVDTTLTIGGDKIIDLIFRLYNTYQPNADSNVTRVKWFVRAFSKTGLETFSDTAGATVRNNPYPAQEPLVISINRLPKNNPGRVKPPDTPPAINSTSTLDFEWTQASDINMENGILIGGFKVYDKTTLQWQTDPGRTVDSVWYQWVGIVHHTFPATKGSAAGTVVVRTMQNPFQNGFTLDAATLSNLFKGFDPNPTSESADSVIMQWWVYTKDFGGEIPFPYNDDGTLRTDVAQYAPTGCQPHVITSGPFWLRLTKLEKGGVEIDEAAVAGNPNISMNVGETKCFTLTAKDKNNNIIRDWNVAGIGMATTLTIINSQANTDSSTVSWNADPQGYTWAEIVGKRQDGTIVPLTKLSDNTFSVPQDLFVDGIAIICFTDTRAESDIYVEVTTPAPSNTAKQNSVHMDFKETSITNYLVEVTSAVTGEKNKIYKMRKYEVIVTPRDRYLNTSYQEIRTRFTARFPGEFDNTIPGLSDIFSGDVFVQANNKINYYAGSRIARVAPNQLQRIIVYSAADPTVRGESDDFQILDHAPKAFSLLLPADQTHMALNAAANPQSFTWQKSVDPYENIQISPRFNPTEIGTDVVKYSIMFVDSISLAKVVKYDSYNLGIDNKFETNEGQLADVVNTLAGSTSAKSCNVFWRVEATDGLYTTTSDPFTALRPGHSLWLDKQGILGVESQTVPSEFTLSNYPNPFNPTTNVSFSLPKQSQVNIVVYDLVGSPVKTLVDKSMAAGSFTVAWDATNDLGAQMPSGNYMIRMQAGSFTKTIKVTLMK